MGPHHTFHTYALDFGAVVIIVEVDHVVGLLVRVERAGLVDTAVEALDLAERRIQ